MAISLTHASIFESLPLPRGGTLLEIGEANWYGDANPACLLGNGHDEQVQAAIDSGNWFAIAKAFYAVTFQPSRIVSVDINGTDKAWCCDLNKPLPPLGQFDVVINHGTAEHVFNIAQVFASMHSACKVGGLMVHEGPFTGWLDHGFYCLQPTLFYDVAAANVYEIVAVYIEHIQAREALPIVSRDDMLDQMKRGIRDNSMLYVAFRKQTAEAFKIPMQGYYAQTLNEAGKEAWAALR